MKIKQTDKIVYSDLTLLLNGKIDAIRIENYYANSLCDEIAEKFISSKLNGKYVNAPLIGRVGQAYFESQSDAISQRNYKANALSWIAELRESLLPILMPNDKLRLELDEAWPHGCSLATIEGNRAFSGLVRSFDEGSYAEPHNDVLRWDLPSESETKICNQLAGNIYLRVPKEGGELIMWDFWPTKEEYEELKNKDSYGLPEISLRGEKNIISPKKGELILFNPMRIHSVSKISKGTRVTSSTFIGYSNNESRLSMWS